MGSAFLSTLPRRAGIRSFRASAPPALPRRRDVGIAIFALCLALAFLVPNPAAREHADRMPTPDAHGPALFGSGLEALRPVTFRLPETVDGPREAWRMYAHAPELNHHVAPEAQATAPATNAAVAAPIAVAVLSVDPDTTGSVPRTAVSAPRSRVLDLPPTGTTASKPLASLDAPDLITRGVPGAPGTFPPMVEVRRVFFTVDPVVLPGVPFDHLAPVDHPRRSRRGT